METMLDMSSSVRACETPTSQHRMPKFFRSQDKISRLVKLGLNNCLEKSFGSEEEQEEEEEVMIGEEA